MSGAVVLTHTGDAGTATAAEPSGSIASSAGGGMAGAALVRSQAGDRASRSQARAALTSEVLAPAQTRAEMAQARQAQLEDRKAHRAAYLVVKAKRDAHARAVAREIARKKAAKERAARLERASRNASRDPKGAARALLAQRGWSGQFGCLDSLWTRESGWNYRASNPSSGAYGIPQALPGGKMASAGSDWRTNPATQIKWGLDYIGDRYGSPCGAWAHSEATGWY